MEYFRLGGLCLCVIFVLVPTYSQRNPFLDALSSDFDVHSDDTIDEREIVSDGTDAHAADTIHPANTDSEKPCTEESFRCRNNSCGGFKYKWIKQMFKGLFYTKKEIRQALKGQRKKGIKGPNSRDLEQMNIYQRSVRYSYHDSDKCCPTQCSSLIEEFLLNSRGQNKTIIHLTDMKPDPLYQFVPVGNCVGKGDCKNCQAQYVTHSLLIYDPSNWPPFAFDEFHLPSYCSCKD